MTGGAAATNRKRAHGDDERESGGRTHSAPGVSARNDEKVKRGSQGKRKISVRGRKTPKAVFQGSFADVIRRRSLAEKANNVMILEPRIKELAQEKSLKQTIATLKRENEKMADLVNAMKEEAKCSICWENSEEDVLLRCGHNFCRPCIQSWMDSKQQTSNCPTCREQISNDDMRQHRAFRKIVGCLRDDGQRWRGSTEWE